jgi:uncharacterized membrane protein YjjP (DUF1212 family)
VGVKKNVRFPDLSSHRDTILSHHSSTTNFSSDDEANLPLGDQDASNLPSFGLNNLEIKSPPESEEDDSFHESPGADLHKFIDTDLSDSSDSEDLNHLSDDPLTLAPHEIPLNDESHSPRRSSLSREQQSTRSSLSRSSKSTQQDRSKPSKLKGILRKMSLANEAYVPGYHRDPEMSNSDSFMGKILTMPGTTQGLSGGGLTPGASRNVPNNDTDEEQQVGFESNDIELKKLDFEELNETAKNLISAHVPNASSHVSSTTNSDYENSILLDRNKESEQDLLDADELYVHRDAQNDLSLQDDLLLDNDEAYIAPPSKVHAGVLSSLLQLYQNPQSGVSQPSIATTQDDDYTFDNSTLYSKSQSVTNAMKPATKLASKLLRNKKKKQQQTRENLSEDDSGTFDDDFGGKNLPSFQNARPRAPKKKVGPATATAAATSKVKRFKHQKKKQRLKITVHIADILQRQSFIMRMCRALMLFGAPTHRLEEYMIMTSRVLEIDGQFIYFPGCMIVSFGDAVTRTSEVHLVRCNQGLNLSKLSDTHKIYKQVVHDLIGVEEASKKLDELLKSKNIYPPWLCVLIYGLGSASVCPFAFSGGWVDIPISFAVGLCVGYLQFFVSSMSNLYSSVFEVSASIVVSFIARAIASIRGGDLFCFSAIAQGSLALILPGYIILCGSLELQSRNLVAGAVRMFYAIIYSLFLGFGITLGAALYGWIDKSAVAGEKAKTCQHPVDDKFRILFVPMFSTCLGLINQARWQQLPAMLVIACTGYVGTFFAGKHFESVTEFTACIGAFIVGILGNLYSRVWKGMAVSAMLPAIFVQVPSGIASQSTLVSGIETADKITNSTSRTGSSSVISLSFGATMVQVSIGISVGLFAAAIVVYPLGKKRTGLFAL